MFGCYSVINIVVLLNLLIAMMNHSYQLISVSSRVSFKLNFFFLALNLRRLEVNKYINNIMNEGIMSLFTFFYFFPLYLWLIWQPPMGNLKL